MSDEDELDRDIEEWLDTQPPETIWRYISSDDGSERRGTVEVPKRLIECGLITADDLIKRPLSTKWERAADIPEFHDSFGAYSEASIWRVRIGDKEYEAENAQMVADWANQGRVTRDTMVFNPWDKEWRRAGDEPKFRDITFAAAKSGCLMAFLFMK